ncbi:hypothetical protein [Sphingomicrobium arenosum]|uniref:hypothetical protein n=1 Tax=Sphingomicrobium arenosum TaxID=2233861 RepID=UPI00224102C4|nr:hypothetical protein [Sphingomicrobium arenosum]
MAGIPWWERRAYLLFLLLLCLLPFALTSIPPLGDLPGHLGRYAVAVDGGQTPELARYYGYRWKLTGNLGADVLVLALAPLIGLQWSVKLVVMAIPLLFVSGLWTLSKAATGRVSPASALAVPLAFAYPYIYGFANYCLAAALALLAAAYWVELGRRGSLKKRALLFLPIALIVYFAHVVGWGLLGLIAFAAEVARRREDGASWIQAAARAALAMWPLLLPLVHLFIWALGRESEAAFTGFWFSFKLAHINATFRDTYRLLDLATLVAVLFFIGLGTIARDLPFRGLALRLAAGLLLVTYVLMPFTLVGSAFADMRLLPVLMGVVVAALGVKNARGGAIIAGVTLAVALFRVGTLTVTSLQWDAKIEERLALIEGLPTGSRLFMVHGPNHCANDWPLRRTIHLGGYHVWRNKGFVNSMWDLGSASPLEIRYEVPGDFGSDPSHLTRLPGCKPPYMPLFDETLADFPRESFDYLWMVDAQLPEAYVEEFELLRRNEASALYRIRPAS